MKLHMLSLCAGIGGADLAASATGEIEIAGQVEIDPFCRSVLAKHWPTVKRLGDIKEVQGDEFGAIDIIAAGFPCTPHSLAGQRRASKDERDLWPEVHRLIGAIRPRWFVGENVPGLLSSDAGRFFGSILRDLDALGYRVGWCVYGACEVGAPHIRERIFIVAYSDSNRFGLRTDQQERFAGSVGPSDARPDGTQGSLAHTTSGEGRGIQQSWISPNTLAGSDDVANTSSAGWQERDTTPITGESGHVTWRKIAPGTPGLVEDSTSRRERQHQSIGGASRAQPLTLQSGTGHAQPGVCRGIDGVSTWIYRNQWPAPPEQEQEAWEPPRVVTTSVPHRGARLKALGNAIVPAQIKPIFDAIVMIERQSEHE